MENVKHLYTGPLPKTATKKSKKVLVVEDEPCLQNAIYRAIRKIDPHTKVIWVASAEEAIELIADFELDLIIADHQLTGPLNGIDLWRQCQRSSPDLPFVMVSGMSKDEFQQKIPNPEENAPPFLAKPFSLLDFQILLEEYL